jgi:type II secretory pathway pseudopilin PulG
MSDIRAGEHREEAGTALVCTLMVTMLLGTLLAALVLIVMANSMASANYGAAQQALYAADAALEHTMSELRSADWRVLPGAMVSARLWDGASAPRAADGTVLDLAALTIQRQADSDSAFGASPDRPVWRLFGHAPFRDLLPGVVVPPAYLVVWLKDDGDEGDGDPERDSNNVLVVRAEAFGASGAHRSVEAVLSLQTGSAAGAAGAGGGAADGVAPPPGRQEVRVLSWREVR